MHAYKIDTQVYYSNIELKINNFRIVNSRGGGPWSGWVLNLQKGLKYRACWDVEWSKAVCLALAIVPTIMKPNHSNTDL